MKRILLGLLLITIAKSQIGTSRDGVLPVAMEGSAIDSSSRERVVVSGTVELIRKLSPADASIKCELKAYEKEQHEVRGSLVVGNATYDLINACFLRNRKII